MLINRLFSLLFVLFFLASCSKEETLDPDLGAQVAGVYVGTKVYSNGQTQNIPANGYGVGVTLTRVDNTNATLSLVYNDNGKVSNNTYPCTLTQSGASVLLRSGTENSATVTGKLIEFRTLSSNGTIKGVDAVRH